MMEEIIFLMILGNFLKMMAEMSQAKHILEIGMFTGYSAVTLAESTFCVS